MIRTGCLLLALAFAGSASAQDEGLPLPTNVRLPDPTGEGLTLQGTMTYVPGPSIWKLGDYWLVTPRRQQYLLRAEERFFLGRIQGGSRGRPGVTLRADVTRREDGVLVATVLESIDPAYHTELRATVVRDGDGFAIESGDPVVRHRIVADDYWVGPQARLLERLAGQDVVMTVYTYDDGTARLSRVRGRLRDWLFDPWVPASPVILPWWSRPGTEYWVSFAHENGKVTTGNRRIPIERLDFDPDARFDGDETPAQGSQQRQRRRGVVDAIPE